MERERERDNPGEIFRDRKRFITEGAVALATIEVLARDR
jgi:hypothetical protein